MATAPYLTASFLWCSKNEMPCSTSRANLSVFNSLRVILDTKTSECDWKFHLSTAPRAGEWAVTAGASAQTPRGGVAPERGETRAERQFPGKGRRKPRPVFLAPGALVGGDEV